MNVNGISQTAYTAQTSAAAGGQVRQGPPPPPPPQDGGGLVGAIGEALQSLGVEAGSDAQGGNAAQALGSFLQELMAALHEQGQANGPAGAGGPPPGQGGFRPEGGPGRLGEDLQSLIESLGAQSEDEDASGLTASFASLLESLGADSSDAQSRLGSFLQALADKLPQAGSSGNLINTTV